MCPDQVNHEVLTVDELLADPITRLVMQADGLDPEQVRTLFAAVMSRLSDDDASREGELTMYSEPDKDYRSGVGIMLLNRQNEVFVGRRVGVSDKPWQMPQGGIDDGEEPLAAALRELREEIGTDKVELLSESSGWLRYDLPKDLVGKAWGGRWRGQQHKWFAMRFLGRDEDIDVATEHPEFSEWRWVPAAHVPVLIVSFKRQLYRDVLHTFREIHSTDGPAGG